MKPPAATILFKATLRTQIQHIQYSKYLSDSEVCKVSTKTYN